MRASLCISCLLVSCSLPESLGSQQQAVGCDGPDSYIAENGEEVICVYTDEPLDPPEDPCLHFPEMCAGDGEEPPPPDPADGGGEEVESPKRCTATPTHPQEVEYGQAMRKALCAIQVSGCNSLLGTAESSSPSQLLSDLHVRRSFDLNCPRAPSDDPSTGTFTRATTFHPGDGIDTVIWLRPPFYGDSVRNQAMVLLHELGHATGRIAMGHPGYYPHDPDTSDRWNDRIYERCIDSPEVTARCGASAGW